MNSFLQRALRTIHKQGLLIFSVSVTAHAGHGWGDLSFAPPWVCGLFSATRPTTVLPQNHAAHLAGSCLPEI